MSPSKNRQLLPWRMFFALHVGTLVTAIHIALFIVGLIRKLAATI